MTTSCTLHKTPTKGHDLAMNSTVAKQLLQSDSPSFSTAPPYSSTATPSSSTVPHGYSFHPHSPSARLTERHFLTTIGKGSGGKALQRDCTVCNNREGKKRKSSTIQPTYLLRHAVLRSVPHKEGSHTLPALN